MNSVECQYCQATDIYIVGHSPLCSESCYRCRSCRGETWLEIDDDSEAGE